MREHFKVCLHLKAVILPIYTAAVIGGTNETHSFFFLFKKQYGASCIHSHVSFLASKPAELTTLIITRALHPEA